MPVRIIELEQRPGVPARELRDGQMARIVAWRYHYGATMGQLVQRHRKALMAIGGTEGASWPEAFDGSHSLPDDCRVEIIPDGKLTLQVFDNQ